MPTDRSTRGPRTGLRRARVRRDQRWTLNRIKTLIGKLFHVGNTVERTWKLMRRRGWSAQVSVARRSSATRPLRCGKADGRTASGYRGTPRRWLLSSPVAAPRAIWSVYLCIAVPEANIRFCRGQGLSAVLGAEL